ncbi:MAG: chemotaxis protein CheX [archaeon]
MKAEYINPIINAVLNVSKNFVGDTITVGKPFIKESPQHFNNLIINIGITGNFKGQSILSFNEETIYEIAGKMMMTEINQIDEMVKSAINEYSNMIMGNAATNFSQINKIFNISSPMIIEGNMKISSNNKFLGIPFCVGNKCFDFYISIEEK